MYHKKLGYPIESGISSGCPFCKASMLKDVPRPGDLIRILTGYDAGMVVRVVDNKYNIPLKNGQFLTATDNDPSGWTRKIDMDERERILFDYIPPSPTPDWAPPICLEYAAELDTAVTRFWGKSLRQDGSFNPIPAFFEVITLILDNRLPIKPEELWAFLEAHGFPYESKKRLTQVYQEGMDLLIYATRKKPFKNRRVEPFSINCKKKP
jgi:hypothetical protein